MTTITQTITALPTPVPQTTDPTNFDARADAFLTALPTLGTELNLFVNQVNTVAGEVQVNAAAAAAAAALAQVASQAAVSATGYVAESATSQSVGTGAKTFTIGAGKSFTVAGGDAVVIRRKGDPSVRLDATTTSYSGGALAVTVTSTAGSGGPFTDWIVVLRAFFVDETALKAQAIAFAVAL